MPGLTTNCLHSFLCKASSANRTQIGSFSGKFKRGNTATSVSRAMDPWVSTGHFPFLPPVLESSHP